MTSGRLTLGPGTLDLDRAEARFLVQNRTELFDLA